VPERLHPALDVVVPPLRIPRNLNTHSPASLYEVLEPQEARRLIEKLEIVYTPTHGSWLNVAEVELAVMEEQSIGGRVPDSMALSERVKS